MAIVHTETPESIREEIRKKASEWHGMYSDTLSVSVGYAAAAGSAEPTVDELERTADAEMYEDKEKHYQQMKKTAFGDDIMKSNNK